MNWNDLVKSRMKQIGITQDGLAERMGVSQASVARYLNKKREPDIETIAEMMKHVGLDKMLLSSDGLVEYPADFIANVSKIDIQPKYQGKYPVLSSVQAGAWLEACEPYQVEEVSEWYETTEKVIGKGFWLRVVGDSMTSSSGISFPEGTLILVDTGRECENKSYVVAKLTDVNEATFKQFIVDAGMKYLMPLNQTYKPISINGNCKVIGVVIDAKLKLL
ncbi:LexA family protein [Vibrio cincinnatiensis]|uniref:LexA family protein n=1 Tax=Vibrio cincinnatiensis TaxID=675 RepID=UPI0030B90938